MTKIMKFLLPLLLFNYVIATEGACPNRFIAFNDTRCFYISNVLTTYHEAKKICGLMDAQLYTPNLDNYEMEGKWLFKYIYVPFFWVAAEKNITNLSTQEGHWVDGNDVKKNMTFMLWDYNHRYNLDHNKIIYGKTIKTAWTHIAGMRSSTSAKWITHQDESSRLLGHKSDGRIYKDWEEKPIKLGAISNWVFDFLGHKEQMWKLLDDGKLLSQGDQAHERMGKMDKMEWYNHPGPPEIPLDYYNSDGPWAFGPENEKGRFYIEHTELNGRLGYADSQSCLLDEPETLAQWHPCIVMLHTDPDSVGYRNPLMFKKETPGMPDCPSCSNGFFFLGVPWRGVPHYEGWSDKYLSLATSGGVWDTWATEQKHPPAYAGSYGLYMLDKYGRYGKNRYGSVWDVEKMSLPHIRRKTGDHARPFGQVEAFSRGVPGTNYMIFMTGGSGSWVEFTSTMEERVSDMQRLLPHVWGDHTYKSSYGHAYLKTHKYLWYQCAVVKESGLWPFTWIPAQCDLMRFPFVCSTEQTE